jgi:hypothetical protein
VDDKISRLTDAELSEAVGGIGTNDDPEALYAVGAKLQDRDNPNIFGSVIRSNYVNGEWNYTIMGSDTRPIVLVEGKLKLKSY